MKRVNMIMFMQLISKIMPAFEIKFHLQHFLHKTNKKNDCFFWNIKNYNASFLNSVGNCFQSSFSSYALLKINLFLDEVVVRFKIQNALTLIHMERAYICVDWLCFFRTIFWRPELFQLN